MGMNGKEEKDEIRKPRQQSALSVDGREWGEAALD